MLLPAIFWSLRQRAQEPSSLPDLGARRGMAVRNSSPSSAEALSSPEKDATTQQTARFQRENRYSVIITVEGYSYYVPILAAIPPPMRQVAEQESF
jgi:hypothetical protein